MINEKYKKYYKCKMHISLKNGFNAWTNVSFSNPRQ
jgi:hypothetical protein